jgi:UDP-GlcNAc3NAcA epimerase
MPMPRMKVLSVVGNRPQFVKSAPLSVALRDAGFEELVLHTGQHYDDALSAIFFDELGLAKPAYSLDLHTADVATMQEPIGEAVRRERPDIVLVFGDTNSTLAGARAAADVRVPVAHVEAGLRSGDQEMPEERNRIEVDRLSKLLFAPDERSRATLLAEGVAGEIAVVGDVMADAVQMFAPIARRRVALRFPSPFVLLTIHREANTRPARLRRLIDEVNAHPQPWLFPVHPRTRRALDEHGIRLAPHVLATDPVGYLEMLVLVERATVVVTDSGGLQKESYWLGTPCVTLRETTEWVDTVEVGANTLVDPTNPAGLGAAIANSAMPADRPRLYGDGKAAGRIAEALSMLFA